VLKAVTNIINFLLSTATMDFDNSHTVKSHEDYTAKHVHYTWEMTYVCQWTEQWY